MTVRWSAVYALVLATGGCQGNEVTRPAAMSPTLLVTNGSCLGGHCDTIVVLGFPTDNPATPAGLWSIDFGRVTTPTACITLPPADTARVIGPRNGGIVDTITYSWTPAKSLSIGSIAPSGNRFMALPTTAAFVPTSAAGWRVDLPGGRQAVADSACRP